MAEALADKAESLKDVLQLLASRNIKLWAEADQLRVRAPKGHLTAEVRALLGAHKADLLELLTTRKVANSQSISIPAQRGNGPRPLSFAQERLWFLNQLEVGGATYNLPAALRLKGSLNVAGLQWSVNQIIERHEILRTVFSEVDGAAVQVVKPALKLDVPITDLNSREQRKSGTGTIPGEGPRDWETEIERLISEESLRPFDLSQGPLLRVSLIKLHEDEFILLLTSPHIVSDGWSISILVKEFTAFYEAYLESGQPELPALSIQYGDYAEWQRQWLQGEVTAAHLKYWTERLAGAPQLLNLPTDRARPAVETFVGATEPVTIPADIVDGLVKLSQNEGATLFMTLLTAFNVLLFRYSGQQDIVVGSSVANRTQEETEKLLGFFVNPLALRVEIADEPAFRELLAEVKKNTLAAYAHQDLPFQMIVDALKGERSLAHSPIFQVMFDLQNTPAEELNLPGLTITPIETQRNVAKFDLTLALQQTSRGLEGSFEYRTDLFDSETIKRMADHFQQLLASIVAGPEVRVTRLQLLSNAERRRALLEWNDTEREYPRRQRIHELFERQAKATPDAIAATCNGAQLNYLELDERANQLGNALIAAGVTTEQRVPLFLDRGLDYLTSMLGVLKTGGAFVPLDPQVADGLTVAVLEECQATLVLTTEEHFERVTKLIAGGEVLCLEELFRMNYPVTPPIDQSCHNSLAYVMYTSGSTGKPKGVMIEHEGMTNHICAHIKERNFSADDVVGQIAKQTFDVSVWQFLCALLVGGRTAIITGDSAWEPSQLLREIRREGITILQTVPSHTTVILDEMEMNPGKYSLDTLRYYMTHAEALTTEQCARWFRNNPGVPMINGYGATEVSDDSSHLLVSEPPSMDRPYVAIHGILPNLKHYILDQALNPMPIGVCGEIYIGGIGIGRGYLNDPALTASLFVPDPFSESAGARLYRVRDLASYRPDGSIEFAGRTDFQIRIRGFRVEIGEIEAVLLRHKDVRQCVVVPKMDHRGDSYLVGYVVPHRYPGPSVFSLQSFMSQHLPAYMVPAHVVLIDEMPLSGNGKVARKNLPDPRPEDLNLETNYVAPRTHIETRLAKLWAKALGVRRVGIRDNFFQLGGHSLIAAGLVIQLRGELDADISLRNLFEAPTIETFLERISQPLDISPDLIRSRGQSRQALEAVTRYPSQEYFELAPSQIPVWFASSMAPDSIVYNVNYSTDLYFKGKVDLGCFVKAWQTLLNRHVPFRMRFTCRDGRPVQSVGPEIVLKEEDFYIDRSYIAKEDWDAVGTQFEREYGDTIFDLENGPLFRLQLVYYGEEQYQILFVTHHIIWDESSQINMLCELSELYNAYLADRPPAVPEIEIEYTDYVQWIRESVASGAFDEHKRYWLAMYETMPPALDLATDLPRPAVQTYNGAWVFSWLPRKTARRLAGYLIEHNATLFMFFLAVIDLYYYRITGQDDLVIGCPIDGRDHESFKRLIGLFATPMPIRCQITPGMSFEDLLRHVAKRSIEAYDHHYYPCANLIEELPHVKDLSRPKLFSIMYGVQHNKTEVLEGLTFDGLQPNRLASHREDIHAGSRFDLNFIVDQWAADISFNCIYNPDLFRRSTVERMIDEMRHLVDQVLEDAGKPLSDYNVSLRENQVVEQFNQTEAAYDETATLSELFERQADETPAQAAVSFGETEVTYADFNRRANQLARYLAQRGVGAGEPVVVLIEPAPELLIALFAILKLGAYYVPVSWEYPEKRIRQTCAHVGSRWIVTANAPGVRRTAEGIEIINFTEDASLIETLPADNLGHRCDSDALAYVIYTSGTTGMPKGIPIKHQGVVNLLASTQSDYHLTTADRLLMLTPLTFDVSIQEIFWPLSYGGTIVIPKEPRVKDPVLIGQLLAEKEITILQSVPVMLQALIEARRDGEFGEPRDLRLIICGAAAMTRRLRDLCLATFNCRLVNHYGPTEVTVDASRFDCSSDFAGDVVPLGRPIFNTKIFVLDDRLKPVSVGIVGELCVGSPGLAGGYLKDPEKTNSAFITTDFGAGPIRLYRTGDLGKFDEDGIVYFIGRKDNQVKVRGNRVELDEVTHALSKHGSVKQALVKYVQDEKTLADGTLIAFVELREEVNSFVVAGEPYRLFTMSQRPELEPWSSGLRAEAWPEYFAGDAVVTEKWSSLNSIFPEYQFGFLNSDEPAAFGNAIPIYWDETRQQESPGELRSAVSGAFNSQNGALPNTLLILCGFAVGESHDGLSVGLLRAFQAVARGGGLKKLLVWVGTSDEANQPSSGTPSWPYILPTLRWSDESGPATWTEQQETGAWVEYDCAEGDNFRWSHVDKHTLRRFLGTLLPDYMVPDQYRFLSSMPLTDSGKIDEQATSLAIGPLLRQMISPRTDLQKQLADIWMNVLKSEPLGVSDDFFDLGGQSLKVVQMLAKVEQSVGTKVRLCDFYQDSTIGGLEQLILEALHKKVCRVHAVGPQGV